MPEEKIMQLVHKVKAGTANVEERTALLNEMSKIVSSFEEILI